MFGVKDSEEDGKYLAYYSGDKNFFTRYVSSFYMLGQEKDVKIVNEEGGNCSEYYMLREYYKKQAKDNKLINCNQYVINMMLVIRDEYLKSLNYEYYDLINFNDDMQAWYGINMFGDASKESIIEDYNNLVESQKNTQYTFNISEKEVKENIAKSFNEIFYSMIQNNYTEGRINLNGNYLNTQAYNNFQLLLNGYTDENGNQYASIFEAFNASEVEYNNSIVWFLETYHAGGGNATRQQQLNQHTFLWYYITQATDGQLRELTRLLNGKTINVDDSSSVHDVDGNGNSLNNGICNTHMIANINVLLNELRWLNGHNNNNWSSFDWKEGFRSAKDIINMGSTNHHSPHSSNLAIDLLNIHVNGANNNIDVETVITYLQAAINSGYFSLIELKGSDDNKMGFHIGVTNTSPNGTTNPTVYFGSTSTSSRAELEYYIKQYVNKYNKDNNTKYNINDYITWLQNQGYIGISSDGFYTLTQIGILTNPNTYFQQWLNSLQQPQQNNQ